jgi:5-methylthioadenosine/S-adenosylhomocysteine deaminase
MSLSRRALVAAGAASALLGQNRLAERGANLPERGEYLIRGARVLSMDAAIGDFASGDIHVRDGAVVAVGASLAAPKARVIAARGMIAMPGLVDTHWHMWNTMLRSKAGDVAAKGYFALSPGVGKFYNASDMYASTSLAAAEAVTNGITCVHDWCHNARSPEHVEQDLLALREAGLRGRFSYGTAQAQPATQTMNLADVERLHKDWERASGGMLQLGMAWRGAAGEAGVWKKEYDTARGLGLPLSTHVATTRAAGVAPVDALIAQKLLDPRVQLIHAVWVTPAHIRAIADAGAVVSLSPFTELRTGFGFPQTGELLAARIPVGLSVDTNALAGNADMFAIMKLIQNVENGRKESEYAMPARRVLELATIEGARSIGLGDQCGSLTPGKRADLILVDTGAINMGVDGDPAHLAHLIVEAASPANVDTVMIDGRILKRKGALTKMDARRIASEAAAASRAVLKRANW